MNFKVLPPHSVIYQHFLTRLRVLPPAGAGNSVAVGSVISWITHPAIPTLDTKLPGPLMNGNKVVSLDLTAFLMPIIRP